LGDETESLHPERAQKEEDMHLWERALICEGYSCLVSITFDNYRER
jgi:hypothetical protein